VRRSNSEEGIKKRRECERKKIQDTPRGVVFLLPSVVLVDESQVLGVLVRDGGGGTGTGLCSANCWRSRHWDAHMIGDGGVCRICRLPFRCGTDENRDKEKTSRSNWLRSTRFLS